MSSTQGDGVAEVWAAIAAGFATLRSSGALDRLRAAQARRWLWSEVTDTLVHRLRADPAVAALIADLEQQVGDQAVTPARAAEQILEAYRARMRPPISRV